MSTRSEPSPRFRRLAAAGILLTFVAAGFSVAFFSNPRTIRIHNGLAVPVQVRVDGELIELASGQQGQVIFSAETPDISTTSQVGPTTETIEAFVSPNLSDMNAPVYNVAGATGFARSGNDATEDAEFIRDRIFDGAPSGSDASVLDVMDNPIQVFSAFPQDTAREMAAAHLQWDPPSSPNYLFWIYALPEAERTTHVSALYDAAPTPRLLMMTLSLMNSEEEAEFCGAAMAVPSPSGHAAVEAAFCARDEQIISLANTISDPWVQLMAGDQAFRDHHFDVALRYYGRASQLQQNNEANLSSRRARTLRLLGRFAEATDLPADEGMYDFYNAIERRDQNAWETGHAAWDRQNGTFDSEALAQLSVATMGDELALGAGSLGAPESWREALARSNQPFQRANAAVVAWGLSWAMDDPALRSRASRAYAALGGPLDLANLDLNAHRSQPELLLAEEGQRGLEHQTQTRLVGIMAWGEDAPPEWRWFVEAALFMAERPHVDSAR